MRKLRPSPAACLILVSIVAVVAGIVWITSRQPALQDIPDTQDVTTSNSESPDSGASPASGLTRAPSEDESNTLRASEVSGDARASEEHRSRPDSTTSSAFDAEGEAIAKFNSEDDLAPANSRAEVGQPFPVSRSMQSQCKRNPVPTAEACAGVSKLLEEMAQEPRDEGWAMEVEAELRAHVLREHPTARIRALECRTSLCAVEVAAETGYLVILGEEEQRKCGIYDLSHASSSFETAPSGSKVTVTLRVFERR
jgi:hypothetical protein